ncbi:alpha-mannosidase [Caldalkalibacillus uzonensis]|uniref:Alpha-mannosidase n=1 Tax=Caldalkalibacillus uzonensis TaxID=353224 RepID=A0ABU0CS22_9BACI|nr:alpha-mannosidase [Caldalkalibacillus uzonensis]MDQ0338671.1 alpha-mannosidase [Caldalkalibacillus uzonensis]
MFWTEEKLRNRIEEMSQYRYCDRITIKSLKMQTDKEGGVGTRPPQSGRWDQIKIGDYWTGRDLYVWIAAEVEIPRKWQDKTVVGLFDFGKTGSGNNSGFESMLYVNNEPYQGVDSNHKEVFLSNTLVGTKVSLMFRLWSGLEGGGQPEAQEHRIRQAEIAWLNEAADDLYFTSKAILDTVNVLDSSAPERHQLLRLVDNAFKKINWSSPGSVQFYRSVEQARQYLNNELNELEKRSPIVIWCIGHTHIDVAWLWRLKHTREKAARSFLTVLRLMEKYSEYIFLQTQPQLYDYLKRDYPEIYQQICQQIREGRWEVDGGMWLEADCNIPSGESLVRQILIGSRFIEQEFGKKCKYLWLPDVFGYSWALPQILKKSGIKTFMTTKISWNQYNRMPHDTFIWRGIDGSEILTHFITTPKPNTEGWLYTYNGEIRADTIKGAWDAYQDKHINQELLVSYGYGDGGGGVNREMLEMRRRLDRCPGMPHVKTGRVDQYFERLHDRVEKTDQYVHTWDGELYLEYHRGTYTSQAYNKRMNRKLELLYRETEWLSALASIKKGWDTYPQQQLNEGWKIILRNQFHDIIPGSSIAEVYEDSREEYDQAQQIGQGCWKKAANLLIQSDREAHAFTIFNSSSWQRDDIVRIPAGDDLLSGKWYDMDGNSLTSQLIDGEWWVKVTNLPPLGYTSIRFIPDEPNKHQQEPVPFEYSLSGIKTPYYEIEWNDKGQLVRIYDVEAERDVLAPQSKGNLLQVFEDKPLRYDAWDIDLYYQEKVEEVCELKTVKLKAVGPLAAVIRFEWQYMESTISQDMIVYADHKRIDFATKVDWHEQEKLLKVAFPVNIRATEATYDIQFGNVKRPTHWNTSWDMARFETVGHQWVDLSENGYGVSLLNDCKYGHDVKDNVLRLTLIKSATYPDPQQDQGEHLFTYALFPHEGNWYEGQTVQHAWHLNNPLTFAKGKAEKNMMSMFRSSVTNIMIDAVKKAEDHNKLILRLHEYTGWRGKVCLTSDLPILSWQEVDLMENPCGEKKQGQALEFTINPYEIKTFMIDFVIKS